MITDYSVCAGISMPVGYKCLCMSGELELKEESGGDSGLTFYNNFNEGDLMLKHKWNGDTSSDKAYVVHDELLHELSEDATTTLWFLMKLRYPNAITWLKERDTCSKIDHSKTKLNWFNK